MIDEVYRNSFKEVHDILENTDDELLAKKGMYYGLYTGAIEIE